jgi:hypothetical protein
MTWTLLLPHYPHRGSLLEVAECMVYGLRRAGYEAELSSEPRPGTRHLVFAAHRPTTIVPDGAVIYQTEVAGSPWWTAGYVERLRRHDAWDYSAVNAKRYRQHGLPAPRVVPPGYVPELERVEPQTEGIDVLFYGSPCPRRRTVLDDLRSRGLNVVELFGVYGAERDEWIARSKVVLSMHYYDGAPAESVRAFYLATNRKCVVAETAPDAPGAAYHDLVNACELAARISIIREASAASGYAAITAQPMEQTLRAALTERQAA